MSDEKPKPVDDLKEGLGLLFRAAKTAVERLPTSKFEDVAKDAVREVGRAFETLGTELEKVVGKAAGFPDPPHMQPPQPPTDAAAPEETNATTAAPTTDDEAPKGPRVG